jgi:hypothetical protein
MIIGIFWQSVEVPIIPPDLFSSMAKNDLLKLAVGDPRTLPNL